jgi:capsular exopolysaccharide synthesis family protein
MSRIHEALKKAAEERHGQRADSGAQAELSVEELTRDVLHDDKVVSYEQQQVRTSGAGAAAQTFQDFVKRCAHPTWRIDPRLSVFAHGENSTVGAERFRTLRSRLFQVATTRPLKRIVVTSSVPAEGKTFITANLAQSFARQPGCRVLLIDADLRASRLHLPFGVPETPGLTDYLKGEANETAVVQVGGEGNLCLIPGGSHAPNPSELLYGARMNLLLDKMSTMFDWILLDSPPALAVHDASLLADVCDGVLFVVQAGSTEFEVAERAAAEFREKNLLGIVLNRVERSESNSDYYQGYYAEHPVAART